MSRLSIKIGAVLILVTGLTACTTPGKSAGPDFTAVVEAARPAVVTIESGDKRGTGFTVSAAGLIVSNAHLLRENAVIVVLADGSRRPLSVLRIDNDLDLALGRIPSETPLPFLTLRSSRAQVGEPVLALGNPFGLGLVASTGIVSALGAGINRPGMLLTDTAINPGNSGGPLLDQQGRVLGIISARAAYGTGVGFAVDAQQLRALLDTQDGH